MLFPNETLPECEILPSRKKKNKALNASQLLHGSLVFRGHCLWSNWYLWVSFDGFPPNSSMSVEEYNEVSTEALKIDFVAFALKNGH